MCVSAHPKLGSMLVFPKLTSVKKVCKQDSHDYTHIILVEIKLTSEVGGAHVWAMAVCGARIILKIIIIKSQILASCF